MTWKIYDEPIDLLQRRFQYFPRIFRWRGQRYEVDAVERCWTVVRRGWRRQAQRHYFSVRCTEGEFELYQDIRTGLWHLRRARLGQVPAPALRQVAPAWQ